MATLFSELIRRVMLGMTKTDGETHLTVKQAINDSQHTLAEVCDWEELTVTDEENAWTQPNVKRYHIIEDLGLVRPKDIISMRLHDDSNSKKLHYVPVREWDRKMPYPEVSGSQRPRLYTSAGEYIELWPIPDIRYPLYIRHTQWPEELVEDDDKTPFLHCDQIIVFLAKDITNAYLSGQYFDFASRAIQYLQLGVKEEKSRVDQTLVARPFEIQPPYVGEYWKDPFFRRDT